MSKRVLVTGGSGFHWTPPVPGTSKTASEVRVLDSLVEQVHRGRAAQAGHMAEMEFIRGRHARPRRRAKERSMELTWSRTWPQRWASVRACRRSRVRRCERAGTAILLEALQTSGGADRRRLVHEHLWRRAYQTPDGEPIFNARRSAGRCAQAACGTPRRQGRPLEPMPTPETKPAALESVYALCKYAQERAVLIVGAPIGIRGGGARLLQRLRRPDRPSPIPTPACWRSSPRGSSTAGPR